LRSTIGPALTDLGDQGFTAEDAQDLRDLEPAAAGKLTKGPAGYREVGCGTISIYDAEGDLLRVVRMARMPEEKKATLEAMLEAVLEIQRFADGARLLCPHPHAFAPEGVFREAPSAMPPKKVAIGLDLCP